MRRFVINVNGNSYEVEVDELEPGEKSEKITLQKTTKTISEPVIEDKPEPVGEGEIVEAPMPGSIFKVNVSKGDNVKAGDLLMILEAMKMENEILAPKDGKVIDIPVSEGVAVDTGDKLIIIQ